MKLSTKTALTAVLAAGLLLSSTGCDPDDFMPLPNNGLGMGQLGNHNQGDGAGIDNRFVPQLPPVPSVGNTLGTTYGGGASQTLVTQDGQRHPQATNSTRHTH